MTHMWVAFTQGGGGPARRGATLGVPAAWARALPSEEPVRPGGAM